MTILTITSISASRRYGTSDLQRHAAVPSYLVGVPCPIFPGVFREADSLRPMPQFFSVATVAERLKVSKGRVQARIKSGEVRVTDLGDTKKRQRVSATDLRAQIDRTFGRQP